jgi:dTDP-glucose pyrophosphorylase
MKDIAKYIVSESVNIRIAVQQMDIGGVGFVAVTDTEGRMVGIVTDGDFRRAVLNGVSLDENVLKIANKNYKYLKRGHSREEILQYFKTSGVECLPIIENGKLVDVIFYSDLSDKNDVEQSKKGNLDLPVVIMAGGKGTRLDPLTRILPKALVPIGEKPVIDIIMDEYARQGMRNFYVSVNNKSKMIKAYFGDQRSDYNITFIDEDKPLGTAGSLKYLNDKVDSPFFVSNCDIFVKNDYCDILKFHKDGEYDLTVVASMQHYTIPYGVCKFENGGLLKSIHEKPKYDFIVNTGMYLLNPYVLKYIPENTRIDMTELINVLQKEARRIGVYPVSEKSWIDIGQMTEYKTALRELLQ